VNAKLASRHTRVNEGSLPGIFLFPAQQPIGRRNQRYTHSDVDMPAMKIQSGEDRRRDDDCKGNRGLVPSA
jgi:hypothetical protein